MTHTDIQSAYGESQSKGRKAIPISLHIAIIKEKPKAGEAAWMAAYIRLLKRDGYEDYLDTALQRVFRMDHPAALQAAFPPTKKEIEKKVAERRERQKEAGTLDAKAKTIVVTKVLSLDLLIDGKKLVDWTFGELSKFSGMLAALSKRGKAKQRVGDVFKTDAELRKAL
jgi:hypothetical protein